MKWCNKIDFPRRRDSGVKCVPISARRMFALKRNICLHRVNQCELQTQSRTVTGKRRAFAPWQDRKIAWQRARVMSPIRLGRAPRTRAQGKTPGEPPRWKITLARSQVTGWNERRQRGDAGCASKRLKESVHLPYLYPPRWHVYVWRQTHLIYAEA